MSVLLAFAVALTSYTQPPGLQAVGGLSGCWRAPGEVRGKDASSVVRGSWHLGGRYFMLQLRSAAAKDPYEAALVYGAGDKPEAVRGYWMDSFGGAYSTPGEGTATNDGFSIVYRYPDSTYTNLFRRSDKGWIWTIMEQRGPGDESVFAKYRLEPATCRGLRFDY
jgi:hypothetical protein